VNFPKTKVSRWSERWCGSEKVQAQKKRMKGGVQKRLASIRRKVTMFKIKTQRQKDWGNNVAAGQGGGSTG
jgi:hypothetical protein